MLAEQQRAAVRGVHVEPGAVPCGDPGDLRERVDAALVGGAGGGDDQERRSGEGGQGAVEGGRVDPAVTAGDDDRGGQAEHPGGTVDAVVGVGPGHHPEGAG